MPRAWIKNGRVLLENGRVRLCDECPCGGFDPLVPYVTEHNWWQEPGQKFRFWGVVHVEDVPAPPPASTNVFATFGYDPGFGLGTTFGNDNAAQRAAPDHEDFDYDAVLNYSSLAQPSYYVLGSYGFVNGPVVGPLTAPFNLAPTVTDVTLTNNGGGSWTFAGKANDDCFFLHGGGVHGPGGVGLTVTASGGTGILAAWNGLNATAGVNGDWSITTSVAGPPPAGNRVTFTVTDWYGLAGSYLYIRP